jgi:OOP family OmpA-OmpF porin
MKKIIGITLCLLLICTVSNAQLLKKLGDKAKAKIGQRTDNKVDKAMDEGLDKVEGKDVKKIKEDENGNVKIKTTDGEKVKIKADDKTSYTSKYDFVPGEKVVAFENFDNASVGDFPTRWNTNATAEVVTINNKEGKWLKFSKEGVWHPEFIKNLPDNFTLEFDLAVNNDWAGSHFAVNFANLNKPQDYTDYYHYVSWRGNHAIHMELKPGLSGRTGASSRLQTGSTGNYMINNNVDFKVWDNASNNFAHISMWRQGQRLRVYANGEKIWDIPRAFDAASKYNAVTFAMQGSNRPEDYFLLGNVRMAIGVPDTRNKLITEGKFVTHGILFDVNSDKIKPESSGALKDIANVLKENSDVKVKIVGHTDADGDDKANLALSQKRAAAVKAYLVSEYGISADNLTTEGKGESQPVDKNSTAEGKANNRRVEFIKQ